MKTENVKSCQGYGSHDSLSVCGSDRKSSMSDLEYDRKSSMSDPEFDPLSDEDDAYVGSEDSEIDGLVDRMTNIKLVPRAPMKHIDNYRDSLRNSTVPWAVQTQNTVTPSGGRVLNNFAQSVLTTNLRNQNNHRQGAANIHVQNIMTTNLQSQSVHPQNVMQRQNVVMSANVAVNVQSQNVMSHHVQNRNIPITAVQNQNVLTTSLSAYTNNNNNQNHNNIYNNNNSSPPPRDGYQMLCPVADDELENEIKKLIENPHKEESILALQNECNRDTNFGSISYLPLSIPLGTDTLPQLSNNDLDEILGIEFFNSDDEETQNDTTIPSLGICDGNADKNDYTSPLSVGLTIVPPSVTSSNCSSPANVDYLLLSTSAASPSIPCTHISAALSPHLDFSDLSATSAHDADLSTHLLRPVALSVTSSPAHSNTSTFPANICTADVHNSIISSLSTHSSFHEVRQMRTSISTNSTPSHPGSSEYSPVSEPQHSPYSSTPDLYQRFSPNIIDAHDTIIPVTVNEDTGDADDSSRSSNSRKSSNQENVSAKDRLLQKFLAEPHLRQEKKKAYLQANLKSSEQLLTFIPSLAKSTDANLEVKLYANMEVFVYNASREQITTLFRTTRFLNWASVKNNTLLSGYVREVMLDHDIETGTNKDYPRIINGAW